MEAASAALPVVFAPRLRLPPPRPDMIRCLFLPPPMSVFPAICAYEWRPLPAHAYIVIRMLFIGRHAAHAYAPVRLYLCAKREEARRAHAASARQVRERAMPLRPCCRARTHRRERQERLPVTMHHTTFQQLVA